MQGLVEHCVEHRRKVAGGAVDDPQHLGGGGLPLQGFARLGQEPRILHCDHRLRGKVFKQGDLLIGKRPYLLAVELYRT
jgi:hypothetical protein